MSGIDAWPERGKEIFAARLTRDVGGGTAITACALARLGSRCRVMAVVGADLGDWIVDRLQSCGVDTAEVQFDATEQTGMTVVASHPEDRAFLTYCGANRGLPELLEARLASSFPLGRHIHLALAPSLERASHLVSAIHEQGSSVSLDVGWRQSWLSDRHALNLLRSIDIFFPNQLEARYMTGEADSAAILRRFAAAGVRRVALKLGSEGAALLWDDAVYFASPHPVVPIDTTGAGDCFNAGFLHAWLDGAEPRDLSPLGQHLRRDFDGSDWRYCRIAGHQPRSA